MIYEVVQLVAAHLRDGAMGVDALAASVPLASGDPALEAVTVTTEFEVPYLAGGRIPASAFGGGPLVLVRRADDLGEFSAPSAPEILEADGRCGVAILVLYPRNSAHALDVENRRLSALLRVVRRSLAYWLEDVPYAARELRGVQVVGPLGTSGVRVIPTIAMIGGEDAVDVVAGVLQLDLNVTDRWAEGITPLTP